MLTDQGGGYDFDVLAKGHFGILVYALWPSPNVLPNELKMKSWKLKIAKQKSFLLFGAFWKWRCILIFAKNVENFETKLIFFGKMRKYKM